MRPKKPTPSKSPEKLPFIETSGAFDSFLATWNFLICFGYVQLHVNQYNDDIY